MTGEVLENHNKDPIIFDIFQKQCCWFVSSQWTVISCHSSGHTPLIAHPLRNTIQIGYQSHAAMCHCYLCHNNIGDILPEDTSLNACMQFSWDLSAVYLLFLYRGSDRFSYNIYSRALFTHSDWRQELSISQPWMKAHTVVSLPACRSGFWLRPTGHRSECISIIIPPLQSLGTDKPSGVKWFIDKIWVAVYPSLLIWISTSEHAMENYY